MADDKNNEQRYEQWLKTLAGSMNTLSLYGTEHPFTQQSMEKTHQELSQLYEDKKEISFGIAEDKLIIEGTQIEGRNPLIKSMLKRFSRLALDTLTIEKNITSKDLGLFLKMLSQSPESITESGGVKAVIKEWNIQGVKIQETYFRKVQKGKKLVEQVTALDIEEKSKELSEYLQGKLSELGADEKKILKKALNHPSQLVEIILSNAKSLASDTELTEEDYVNVVSGGIRKIGDHLVDESIQSKGKMNDYVKQLQQLKKTMEEELKKGAKKLTKENVKKIVSILDEYIDNVKINYTVGNYLRKKSAVEEASDAITTLDESLQEKEMLLPLLQERLRKEGLDEEYFTLMKKILNQSPETEAKTGGFDALEKKIKSVFDGLLKGSDSKKESEKHVGNLLQDINNEVTRQVDLATQKLQKAVETAKYDKQRTELVLRNISDGLVVVDNDGKIVMMNDAAETMLGVTEKEKLGKSIVEGLTDEQMVTLSHDTTDKKKGELQTEIEIKSSENARKTLRASSGMIQNEQGKTIGMVSVLSDVSKQKELEEMRVQLVNNLSDELKAPLASLRQVVSILSGGMAGTLSPEQEKYMSIAQNSLGTMLKKVDSLFDFSKVEEESITINPGHVSIDTIVDDVIENLSVWASSKKITLKKNIVNDLPEVLGDRDKLYTVLLSLGTNAIKFTDSDGTIIFEIEYLAESKDHTGRYVKLSVSDNGIGIPPKEINQVFDKYHYLSKATSMMIKGTGLELPLAKKIVELHGGKIWVVSEEGKGTTVSFLLPRV